MWNLELNNENNKYWSAIIASLRYYKIWKIKRKNKRILIFREYINIKGGWR